MEASFSNHFLAIVLIILVFTSYTITATGVAGKSSNEFIKTSCTTTTYPTLCYNSLLSHAGLIQTSPKLLAHTALSVALDTAVSTSDTMVRLSRSHGVGPREVMAMRDCVELLSDSVDRLRKSLGEMGQLGGSNFRLIMSDIQTWVSAALTDDDTCTDGFGGKGMNENMKIVVRGHVVATAHMTSNALGLINNYASLQG